MGYTMSSIYWSQFSSEDICSMYCMDYPSDDEEEIDLSQLEAETDQEQTYESYDLDMLSNKDFLY